MNRTDVAAELAECLRRKGVDFRPADVEVFAANALPRLKDALDMEDLVQRFAESHARGYQRRIDGPVILLLACFCAVIFTAPFNMILGFLCWDLLEYVVGGHAADNSGGGLMLLLCVLHTTGFAAMCLPIYFSLRRASAAVRGWVVLAITTLYLGFWFVWNAMAYIEMVQSGKWP